MPKLRLTDVTVRSLSRPEKGQITYWDESVTGFGLRLSQGGTKSFVLMHGANRQLTTIGRYPTISLADARTEAKRLMAEHTLGKIRPANVTYDDALAQYLDECRGRNKPRTVHDYKRLLTTHFKFGRTQVADITQHEIMRRVRKLAPTPTEQSHAFVAARAFFRWLARNQYIDWNPLDGLRPPSIPKPRERVLDANELAALYKRALAYPYGSIVSLLVLTGQRRGEIAALQWDWIDRDDRLITLPGEATKNGRIHRFPYGAKVADIIDQLPEINEYLFPASRTHVRGKRTTIFNAWPKSKIAFDKELQDIAPYTLHDLRRTFSTTLASLNTPIHVTEKILNHVSGTLSGVAGIYNQHTYMDEMRHAITTYERHLENLIAS